MLFERIRVKDGFEGITAWKKQKFDFKVPSFKFQSNTRTKDGNGSKSSKLMQLGRYVHLGMRIYFL